MQYCPTGHSIPVIPSLGVAISAPLTHQKPASQSYKGADTKKIIYFGIQYLRVVARA